jgi:hypothetical protein
MELLHPQEPRVDYVEENKFTYGLPQNKSYKTLKVKEKEAEQKLTPLSLGYFCKPLAFLILPDPVFCLLSFCLANCADRLAQTPSAPSALSPRNSVKGGLLSSLEKEAEQKLTEIFIHPKKPVKKHKRTIPLANEERRPPLTELRGDNADGAEGVWAKRSAQLANKIKTYLKFVFACKNVCLPRPTNCKGKKYI